MSTLEKFIINLSYRFKSENDLSDITWTMCQTSERFQLVFLRFFFPWLKKDCANVYIFREKSKDDSRPDFVFEYRNEKYVIENKIGDQKQHFEQYLRTFKIEANNLGYIANYTIVKSGFVTHTWKELYLFLQQNIPEEEKTLWEAYLQYLKNVCYIYLPTKPMDLKGMNSLYTFYRCLDDVFAFDNEYFHSELYDSRFDTKGGGNFQGTPREGILGKYFKLKYNGIRVKETRGWMGVYFMIEEPEIWIGFRNFENWGQPVCRIIENSNVKSGKLYYAPGENENAWWFKFKTPKYFDELSLQRQENLLKKFFEDVIMAIYDAKVSC